MIVQEDGNYCFPKGFSFDINYNQQIIFSEGGKKSSPAYDSSNLMRHLERYVNRLLKSEANDHTYLMFGCDYAFTAAEVDYENMDRVI